MRHLLYALLATARSSLQSQRELALENLALRHRLAIVHRKTKRPKLTKAEAARALLLHAQRFGDHRGHPRGNAFSGVPNTWHDDASLNVRGP